MKKILNIAAVVLVIAGEFLKAGHYPGANIAIILSGVLMLTTLFMYAVKDNKEAGANSFINYLLVGALALFIIGAIFKFHHWVGSGILVDISIVVFFILPIILILSKSEFKVSRQYVITFFTYFILVLAALHSNPVARILRMDNMESVNPGMDTVKTAAPIPSSKGN